MKLAENLKVVPVLALDTIGSGGDANSINMARYHHCTFVMTCGTLSGDGVLTINSGATDGAKTSALTFNYAVGGAAIGSADCDVLAADTAVATLTMVAATYTDKMILFEVDASAMDLANDENWLTLSLSNAGTSGAMDVVAILEPRYSSDRSVSALV